MRASLLVLLALTGCYGPSPEVGAPCSSAGLCPTPLVCLANVCTTAGGSATPDASARADAPGTDATHDAPPLDADASSPLLLLHMDDSPADGALDSAGNHQVPCGAKCPFEIADGRIGGAYRFRSSAVLTALPPADFAPGTAFSIAVWIRAPALPTSTQDGFYTLVGKSVGGTDSTYALLVTTAGAALRAQYYVSSNSFTSGSGTFALATWHHLAMTWDGATMTGYLDGVQDAQFAVPPAMFTVDDAQPLTIGQINDTDSLTGDLDELAFYPRALSATEVTALANP